MSNAKNNKKPVPAQGAQGTAENNPAATPENAATDMQATAENTQPSGANTEKQENTGVDTKEQTPATRTKKDIAQELEGKAKKIFGKYSVELIYFTSNGMGFLKETDAKNHAAKLVDKTITIIKRK
jgi:hypothetical protein